jgi:N-acetylmuramoyl-L-alanine amidase
MKKQWWLDPGHGGIVNGQYTTPGKRSPEWEKGVYFEGVGNRDICRRIIDLVKKNNLELDVRFAPYVGNVDTSLNDRTNIINAHYKNNRNLVVVSVHSNAGAKPNQGSGLMCFTSKGQTESDKIADQYYLEMRKLFPGERFYIDSTDGDSDWEADFHMLLITNCPAVLSENFFMDTKKDYLKLFDEDVRNKIALGHVNMMLSYEGLPTLNA